MQYILGYTDNIKNINNIVDINNINRTISQLIKCCSFDIFKNCVQIFGSIVLLMAMFMFIWQFFLSCFKGNILISEIFSNGYKQSRYQYLQIYEKNLNKIANSIRSINFVQSGPETIKLNELIGDSIETLMMREASFVKNTLNSFPFIPRTVINIDNRLDNAGKFICNQINQFMFRHKRINRVGFKANKIISITVEEHIAPNDEQNITSNDEQNKSMPFIKYDDKVIIYETTFNDINGTTKHHYLVHFYEDFADFMLANRFDSFYENNIFVEKISFIDGYENKYIIFTGEKNISMPVALGQKTFSLEQIMEYIKQFKNIAC